MQDYIKDVLAVNPDSRYESPVSSVNLHARKLRELFSLQVSYAKAQDAQVRSDDVAFLLVPDDIKDVLAVNPDSRFESPISPAHLQRKYLQGPVKCPSS